MAKPLPPLEILLEYFEHDFDTGVLMWRKKVRNAWPGDTFGYKNPNDYIIGVFEWQRYRAHRLIWKMYKEYDPLIDIDHKNLIKHDNRIDNLREATPAQNGYNTIAKPYSASGIKGVRFAEHAKKWVAHCRINGVKRHLGYFTTAEEALAAYKEAVTKYHGEFARASN